MTTVSTQVSAGATQEGIKNLQIFRSGHPFTPNGLYLLTFTKTLTAAETLNFDGSGDFLEMYTFPPNTRLLKASAVVPDMDSHATPAVTIDMMAGSTVLVNNDTAGQAGGTINYDSAGVQDVSSTVFKLKIETVAATVPASYSSAFTSEALVYIGAGKAIS